MRRIISALVTIVVLTAVAPPARADVDHIVCARMGSAPKGTTFKIQGSGRDTIVGGWRTQGDRADLCFRGLAGANGKTSITGQWTSPWQTMDSGGFSGSFQLITANPTDDVTYTVAARVRFTGDSWGSWFSDTLKAEPAASLVQGAEVGETFVIAAGPKPRHLPQVQWQWRVTAVAPVPAVLDVGVDLSTH